jgi:hypothetical protein
MRKTTAYTQYERNLVGGTAAEIIKCSLLFFWTLIICQNNPKLAKVWKLPPRWKSCCCSRNHSHSQTGPFHFHITVQSATNKCCSSDWNKLSVARPHLSTRQWNPTQRTPNTSAVTVVSLQTLDHAPHQIRQQCSVTYQYQNYSKFVKYIQT